MNEVIFEFIRQGIYMKVSAIHIDSKIEAVVVVPANISEVQMKTNALNKLKYLIAKEKE